MTLVYIHGANATGSSFNYIRDKIQGYHEIVIEYSTERGFENNLESMREQLKGVEKMFFICHSLGGIYALHLANLLPKQVVGAVTISTPYGGSNAADYAKYFAPFSRLLKEIGPRSKPMIMTRKISVLHPWCNVVSTRGNSPWMLSANDGVVTVDSQKHRPDMEHVEIHTNHYEVVINPETVNIIQQRLARFY